MVVVDVDHPDIEKYINWKVQRGAEGRRPRRRLEGLREASRAGHEGLRQLRGPGRGLLRSDQEPGAEARGPRRQEGERAGELHPARHPVRPPGLHADRFPDLRHRLGFGGLSHRLRPELQQFRPRHRRFPSRGGGGRRLDALQPHHRQGGQDAQGARRSGSRSASPPGPPPIPASSTTPPSTTGTPASPTARSAPPIRARNTCSSTTRPAISPR